MIMYTILIIFFQQVTDDILDLHKDYMSIDKNFGNHTCIRVFFNNTI